MAMNPSETQIQAGDTVSCADCGRRREIHTIGPRELFGSRVGFAGPSHNRELFIERDGTVRCSSCADREKLAGADGESTLDKGR